MALTGIKSAEVNSALATAPLAGVNMPDVAAGTSSNSGKAASGKVALFENVDTVTLQGKSGVTGTESRTEKVAREENNKSNSKTRAVSDVLFDYNASGDLRIKFMDSGNNLIYQTPPVLFAKIADLMIKPNSAVDTKV